MILRLDPESVCHPRDVVEVPDDLRGIMDRAVVESMTSEYLDVFRAHVLLVKCELHRMGTQGTVRLRQRSGRPVAGNGVNEGVRLLGVRESILDLCTEVMRVRLSSVETVVGSRCDHREHLPLRSGER